ncbi:MAG: serine hydrolase domain-containing protein [Microbacterium sp.]
MTTLDEVARAMLVAPDFLASTAPASLAAVVHEGRVVAVQTRGEPRCDGQQTTENTVFRIASMSKSFLAATALALRDEGAIDLHAPAAEYVPELDVATFDGHPVRVTLSDLLSNRAGLAEDNAWGDEHLGLPRDDMARLVAEGLRMSAIPQTEYQYSNIGISIIGRAIERVTGRDVEHVIRERMLEPLGLRDTWASASDYPQGTDLAHGFRTFDDGASFVPEPYVGSGALACIGSLFSTAADIARWVHFLSSAFTDEIASPDVLSAASRRELQTARTLIPLGADGSDGAGYGYGLRVEHDRRFGRIVQHAGGLPGFSSYMCWHAATGVGAVVFGNSDEFPAGSTATSALTQVLAGIDAPAAVVRPRPETVAAARRIDELLRGERSLGEAGPLLARNVLRDVPEAVRSERFAALTAEVGHPIDGAPFEDRVVSAAEQSALRWTIPCERGALVCDVRMVGLAEPLVQGVSVRAAGPDGRKPQGEAPRVTDHHRAVL